MIIVLNFALLCVTSTTQQRFNTPSKGNNCFISAETGGIHRGNPYNHFPKVRHAKYADAHDPLPDMRRDDNIHTHTHTHTNTHTSADV